LSVAQQTNHTGFTHRFYAYRGRESKESEPENLERWKATDDSCIHHTRYKHSNLQHATECIQPNASLTAPENIPGVREVSVDAYVWLWFLGIRVLASRPIEIER